MAVGELVRQYRKAAGLSQQDLADLADLSQARVSLIETGRVAIRLDEVVSIAAALDVSSSMFMLSDLVDNFTEDECLLVWQYRQLPDDFRRSASLLMQGLLGVSRAGGT